MALDLVLDAADLVVPVALADDDCECCLPLISLVGGALTCVCAEAGRFRLLALFVVLAAAAAAADVVVLHLTWEGCGWDVGGIAFSSIMIYYDGTGYCTRTRMDDGDLRFHGFKLQASHFLFNSSSIFYF